MKKKPSINEIVHEVACCHTTYYIESFVAKIKHFACLSHLLNYCGLIFVNATVFSSKGDTWREYFCFMSKQSKNNFFSVSDFYFFTKLYLNPLPLPCQKRTGSSIASCLQPKLEAYRTLVLAYV